MNAALVWASVRFARAGAPQMVLAVAGIGLGIAVMVAIDIAIDSSRRAFELGRDAVTGTATHRVVGGSIGVDERAFAVIFQHLEGADATALVEGRVQVRAQAMVAAAGTGSSAISNARTGAASASGTRRWMGLLGIDPFAASVFSNPAAAYGFTAGGSRADLMTGLLADPRSVVTTARTAARLGVSVGQSFTAVARNQSFQLRLVGVLGEERSAGVPSDRGNVAPGSDALDDLLIMDLAGAQEVLSMVGRLSSIELVLHDPGAEQVLEAVLPGDLRVETAAARSQAMVEMTRAFDLNLRMLALLALVIGVFLIYNTVSFAVVRRRQQFGIMRALGVTRGQLLAVVIGEAVVLGVLGAIVGVALGLLLADGLLALVSRTINDLYFAVAVREIHISPGAVATGMAAGLVAAVAAAAVPAWEAARIAPASAMVQSTLESAIRARAAPLALAGAGLLALSALMLFSAWGGAPAGGATRGGLGMAFAALFGLVAGAGLLAPAATVGLLTAGARLLATRPGKGRGPQWMPALIARLAVAGNLASLSRTALAVAALMVAVSATVGVGVMVDSFRTSVADWLERSLRADIYVGGPGSAEDRAITPELIAAVRALPEVEAVSLGRRVTVNSDRGPLSLLALHMAPLSYAGVEVLAPREAGLGAGAALWQQFDRGEGVLVTEALASRLGLRPGDNLQLAAVSGPVELRVLGVYRDYASERGSVLISRRAYLHWWNDVRVTGMGLYLRGDRTRPDAPLDSVEVERVQALVEGLFTPASQLRAVSNRVIRTRSMAVFDRTFTVTGVLKLLAVVVAFFGILNACLAIQLERARHFAVLRAAGMTRAQLFALIELECGGLGLVAGLLSLPLGLVLAHALIEVINRRAFGWSMDFALDPALLFGAVALSVSAALLAGLWPAWRMSRRSPAQGLRGE